MQEQRQPQDQGMGDRFGMFSRPRSLVLGRNPFDDPPFFTRPFNSMFQTNNIGQGDDSSQIPQLPRGPRIQLLNSDDEIQGQDDDDDDDDDDVGTEGVEPKKFSCSKEVPFVNHPDDEVDGQHVHEKYYNANATPSQAVKYRYCKVTYGGVDGEYYTTTSTQGMGADGVLMEECREADKTTGQATHRVSRGIKDKGHSVTRKLKSDGKVETLQTFHNLKEDELTGFDEAWQGSTQKQLPAWNRFNTVGNTGPSSNGQNPVPDRRVPLLPGDRHSQKGEAMRLRDEEMARRAGKQKKVIRINIE